MNDRAAIRMKLCRLIVRGLMVLAVCALPPRARAQVPADREGLLSGEGMGQAAVADMNGYPGPKHVLDLAGQLRLSDSQISSMRQVLIGMEARARELGKRIVGIEEELNDAFRTGLVSEKAMRDDAEQIGKLRGRLRAVHLAAHLRAGQILSQEQLALYRKLRGAADTKGGHPPHGQ